MGHARDHGLPSRIGVDVPDQRDVELHVLRLQLEDVVQPRIARAGVVDGQHGVRPNLGEGGHELRVVLDLGVLGDLENNRPIGPGDHVQQRHQSDRQRGRDVEAHE